MKLCPHCHQIVAQGIITCPACGSDVGEGLTSIDTYRIKEVVHEGYSSLLCRAVDQSTQTVVMLRIFTPQSGVDARIAERLKQELEHLQKLPEDYFVRHLAIRQSSEGLWYRVSEWIDAINWGNLLVSGRLEDYGIALKLFYRITQILEGLHQIGHFIPHLILDDIIVYADAEETLKVKIDYKLSRFLDPHLDRPGPMLRKLLQTHPDILNRRPLDRRSDIWSLGKIWVELFSGDPNTTDYHAKIDKLLLPPEVEVLLRVMLADDPDLRPQSMAEVAQMLAKVKRKDLMAASRRRREALKTPWRAIIGLRNRMTALAVIVGFLVLSGAGAWYYFAGQPRDSAAKLAQFANRYAGSVAFVLVDYQLKDEDRLVYQNRTEGTAFLVDLDGYLITNRHVAAPWLEDRRLHSIIQSLKFFQRTLSLEYRLWLWFEGARAFKRLPGLTDSTEIEDQYVTQTAYRSDGSPGVVLAGVARPPVKSRQMVRSPLMDDFAVLKIDRIPEGLVPLQLDYHMTPQKIPRLSPVITLGFPLGSKTQQDTVNVSVTRGHVRRIFETLIQVDASIYQGNSGGPFIDTRGKVIGIASRVAVDPTSGPPQAATILSDIGMVLPITKAVAFYTELKNGQLKWDGILDLGVESKIQDVTALARQHRWQEAQALADRLLEGSRDPGLSMADGMMHFCNQDFAVAQQRFNQVLSMDPHNHDARLMLYLIDWMSEPPVSSPHRDRLLALDWQSPAEFFGHLARVLEGRIPPEAAQKGGYSKDEKAWLHYALGLMQVKQQRYARAEERFRHALLLARSDSWLYFLLLAHLDQLQPLHRADLSSPQAQAQYDSDVTDFQSEVQQALERETIDKVKLNLLMSAAPEGISTASERRRVLQQVLVMDPTDGNVLFDLAFYSAMDEAWEEALGYTRQFLALPGRYSASRLSLALLEPSILNYTGQTEAARKRLQELQAQVPDAWYRAIGECLLGDQSIKSLTATAGDNPAYLITGYTALGFWAEGNEQLEQALHYYREALGTYMDDWREFEFAWERMKRLRQSTEESRLRRSPAAIKPAMVNG